MKEHNKDYFKSFKIPPKNRQVLPSLFNFLLLKTR